MQNYNLIPIHSCSLKRTFVCVCMCHAWLTRFAADHRLAGEMLQKLIDVPEPAQAKHQVLAIPLDMVVLHGILVPERTQSLQMQLHTLPFIKCLISGTQPMHKSLTTCVRYSCSMVKSLETNGVKSCLTFFEMCKYHPQ